MLIALTGPSGFVGSYTARALHAAGHEVRALVRSTSRRDHIAPFVADFYVGDQADQQSQVGLVANVDAVIHNAADWDALGRGPGPNFEQNVLSSLRLLEAARQAGARQFLFVSSVAIYHEILPDRPLDENHPTWPDGTNAAYGAYKAAVEPYLKAYSVTYGMNCSAWRPAAIYGMDPDLGRCRWIELIKDARDGGVIDTPQGGKITHVQDVADALTLAIGDESTAGQFYNLVDRYMYWQQAAEFAREITNSKADIIDRKGSGPRNNFDTRKVTAFFDRHANTTALRRGLDGVKDYVRELLNALPSG